ncbi:MAG: phosphoribosylformylglycinamidine synthase I [Candidatus Heimdallarchaeaceae archaeon]
MNIGVTKFPGTNNEQDVLRTLSKFNVSGTLLKPYSNVNLTDFDALILAGGFSYGDYLRPGAIAAQSILIEQLKSFVEAGHFVIGICNGFQILCETGILPGALTTNTSTRFISKWVYIKSQGSNSPLLQNLENKIFRLPIAHFEGRYYAKEKEVEQLQLKKQLAFQYCDENGFISEQSNPNGSTSNIAGITNSQGNVLGLMPHPERASFAYLGSTDGEQIFRNLVEEIKC